MMYDELVQRLRFKAGFDSVYDSVYDEAADAIEDLQHSLDIMGDANAKLRNQVPDWIPVTERLPEEFQPVWVACKMEGRENWTFDTIYDPYLKCPWGQYYYLEKGEAVVYAWMDRSDPEPPEEVLSGTKE